MTHRKSFPSDCHDDAMMNDESSVISKHPRSSVESRSQVLNVLVQHESSNRRAEKKSKKPPDIHPDGSN